MRLSRDGDRWAVEGGWYRLHGAIGGPVAVLDDLDGRRWAELRLLASVETITTADETLAVVGPAFDDDRTRVRCSWDLSSSTWRARRLAIDATDDELTVRVTVEGTGDLTTVSLLAGRVVSSRASGFLMSGAWFESIVPAGPGDPGRIVVPASESASIGVVSGSEPGRGRWFFTPGPFVFAAARGRVDDPLVLPGGPWLSFAIDAVAGEAGFTEVAWRAADRGFGLVLEYDGHTRVADRWTSPPLVIGRGDDPYAGIAAQRERLRARVAAGLPAAAPAGLPAALPAGARAAAPAAFPEQPAAVQAPQPAPAALPGQPAAVRAAPPAPDWWREPIFCGWGAQCADAAAEGEPLAAAAKRATQANYDRWLAHLATEGIVPGTVVLDDKWQQTYGVNEPDTARWPDLQAWIAGRHGQRQRVLLWYKAWDPEGLPAEICVRTTAGTPIAIDPTHPDGEAAIRRSVRTMLAPDGLDADGLKIDFTARTPSGRATVRHGDAWGVDLLRLLIEVLADAARAAKPDALLVAQTPNPIVAPAVGMIRLNDALRLDDPRPDVDVVPQMRYRAAIARAACPDHLIDTDDWCMPDLATWRAYTAIKPELGIPALYYVTHLDRTLERFEPSDYALIRATWAAYRDRVGLSPRP